MINFIPTAIIGIKHEKLRRGPGDVAQEARLERLNHVHSHSPKGPRYAGYANKLHICS